MNYVLDTNILLYYLRDSKTKEYIESTYNPLGVTNTPIISVVTVGEIKSLSRRNHWGEKRLKAVLELIDKLVITNIRYESVLDAYAELDTFSQGKLEEKSLNMTARNMGKNDLWIAATTMVTNSKLITSDNDFDHLNGNYFEVIKIKRVK